MPQQNRILRPFDYDSIMLYGPKLFSRNGQDTMIPMKRGIRLLDTGVKNGLSDEDAVSINLLYGCHDTRGEEDASGNSPAPPATGSKGQPAFDTEVDKDTKHPKVNTIDNISGHEKYKPKDGKDILKKTGKRKSFYTPRETVNRETSTKATVSSTTPARRLWSRSPWKEGKNKRTIKTTTTAAGEAAVTVRRTVTASKKRRGEEDASERRTTSSPPSVTLAVKERRERKEGNVLRTSDRQRETQ